MNGKAAAAVFGLILLATSPCLRAQRAPSLDRFDAETRQSLELTCLISRTEGAAAYAGCLNGHIEALRKGPPVPDLTKFDDATRRSLQAACVVEKRRGPALYARCLNGEIAAARSSAAPSPPRGGRAPAFPQLQWSGAQKPEIPSATRSEALAPDALFGAVEKSVYVLVSAPSLKILKEGGGKQGSAVAVSSSIALTNCHVLEGNRIHFLVKDRALHAATISYGHKDSDRCAVEVRPGRLSPVRGIRRHSTLVVGERVYAIGSPSGFENSLSEGLLSGLRKRAGLDLVQISAPVSPGSSGGGLFDGAGNLIGITTFGVRDTQGLNFAIAADAYWR